MVRAVEDHYPRKEWEAVKFQTLCSPNVFDFGRPAHARWGKERVDSHRRIKNTRRWIEHFCRIRNKGGEIVPITLNYAQRKFLAKVLRRWRKGQPARVAILKPRQTGFCYNPAMKILMADMTWRPIGEVQPGESVVAFDEEVPGGKGRGRSMREATVIATKRIQAEAFKIVLDDGRELIATGPHRHLCKVRGSTATEWRTLDDLRVGDQIRSVVPSVWGPGTTEDAWMGGIFDGEGWIRASESRAGVEIGVCQADGPVWDRILAWFKASGLRYRVARDERKGDSSKLGSKAVNSIHVTRIGDIMRFAGLTGATKLEERRWWDGRGMPGKNNSWATVTATKLAGEQTMVDLQTTEGTYVAEGLASHNSTVVELLIFYLACTNTYRRGAVIAHKNQISTKILNMFRTALKFVPYDLPTRHRTRYEVVFEDPINSSVDVDSAESEEPGHGDTVQYLHLTEVSRWKDAARKAKGVMQTVPDLGMTLIVWESTANGAEGYFFDLYNEAKDTHNPNNRMDAVFVAWFEHAEYRMPRLPDHVRAHIEASLDAEELDLLRMSYFVRGEGRRGVDLEQLAWRRHTIVDKCGGSLEDFHEQYPSTDMEAFLSSGRPVFTAQKLIEREAETREPIWEGDLFDPEFAPKEVPDRPGSLSEIKEAPAPAGPIAKHVEWPKRAAFKPLEGLEEEANDLLGAFGAQIEAETAPRHPDRDAGWADD